MCAPVTAFVKQTAKGDGSGREGRFMFLGFAKNGAGFVCYDHKKNSIFHAGKVTVRDSLRNIENGERVESEKQFEEQNPNFKPRSDINLKENIVEAKQQIVDNEPDQILIPQDIEEELVEDQRIAVGERNREKTQRLNIGHDVWQTLVQMNPNQLNQNP